MLIGDIIDVLLGELWNVVGAIDDGRVAGDGGADQHDAAADPMVFRHLTEALFVIKKLKYFMTYIVCDLVKGSEIHDVSRCFYKGFPSLSNFRKQQIYD